MPTSARKIVHCALVVQTSAEARIADELHRVHRHRRGKCDAHRGPDASGESGHDDRREQREDEGRRPGAGEGRRQRVQRHLEDHLEDAGGVLVPLEWLDQPEDVVEHHDGRPDIRCRAVRHDRGGDQPQSYDRGRDANPEHDLSEALRLCFRTSHQEVRLQLGLRRAVLHVQGRRPSPAAGAQVADQTMPMFRDQCHETSPGASTLEGTQ